MFGSVTKRAPGSAALVHSRSGEARAIFVAVDQRHWGFDGEKALAGFGPGPPLLKDFASDSLVGDWRVVGRPDPFR